MQQYLPYVDIVGNTAGQLTMSTAGTATTGQLSSLPSVYGLWASQDAYISITPPPLSTAPLTIATGYLIKGALSPVAVKVPPYGQIVAVSSSSGTLGYERIGSY